ncbi:hypothetical protein CLLU_12910 [Clostridium luticellarii]|uniref:Sema domain-containing protein n=1 Tax=Clostridium luticellarii TaxID=1691940 RepID=A0A2T0BP96_9CLOT|nr:hypothetical protein CLLU_12910 [Clostridium luticellarii]
MLSCGEYSANPVCAYNFRDTRLIILCKFILKVKKREKCKNKICGEKYNKCSY